MEPKMILIALYISVIRLIIKGSCVANKNACKGTIPSIAAERREHYH